MGREDETSADLVHGLSSSVHISSTFAGLSITAAGDAGRYAYCSQSSIPH